MRFAERARQLSAAMDIDLGARTTNRTEDQILQEVIADIAPELAQRTAVESMSLEKMKAIQEQAVVYFENNIDSMKICSKEKVKQMFENFRVLWNFLWELELNVSLRKAEEEMKQNYVPKRSSNNASELPADDYHPSKDAIKTRTKKVKKDKEKAKKSKKQKNQPAEDSLLDDQPQDETTDRKKSSAMPDGREDSQSNRKMSQKDLDRDDSSSGRLRMEQELDRLAGLLPDEEEGDEREDQDIPLDPNENPTEQEPSEEKPIPPPPQDRGDSLPQSTNTAQSDKKISHVSLHPRFPGTKDAIHIHPTPTLRPSAFLLRGGFNDFKLQPTHHHASMSEAEREIWVSKQEQIISDNFEEMKKVARRQAIHLLRTSLKRPDWMS